MVEHFVERHSIVRQIWGKSDTILFIFAGASAEFALNKAVDWLYFTGRLPSDPLGRLFSTVAYANAIIFSERTAALRAIDSMVTIHSAVETKRGEQIPDWAYRDVLFMLIDYSIRSFEVLERKLTAAEKNEVFKVFHTVGTLMGISGLPNTFDQWVQMRQEHLKQNMHRSNYTNDLFRQYQKHLGSIRYRILIEAQTMIVPKHVSELLDFRKVSFLNPAIIIYKIIRSIKMDRLLKALILPSEYKDQLKAFDVVHKHLSKVKAI